MVLEFSKAKKRKAAHTADCWRMIPTRRVYYEDYPTIRTIFRRGWRIINMCAPEDGQAIVLDG